MTIEELEDKHRLIAKIAKSVNCLNAETHTNLSIEYTISVLEDLNWVYSGDAKVIYTEEVEEKIQELKQYLEK